MNCYYKVYNIYHIQFDWQLMLYHQFYNENVIWTSLVLSIPVLRGTDRRVTVDININESISTRNWSHLEMKKKHKI